MVRYENFFTNAKRYIDRYKKREIFSWYKLFRYYIVFVPFMIVGLVALFIYIKPVTPKVAYLAIGQAGSSYGVMADKFKVAFAKFGLDLQLVETDGLSEGLRALDDPNSQVNASFITAGIATSENLTNLVSLGSIQYAPIWIFYKGNPVTVDDPFEYFAGKKISIGLHDTMANKLFRKILSANNSNTHENQKFIELPHLESAEGLKGGSLDAAFIVDSYSAPVIQKLLSDPEIRVMSFNLADAYVRKFPFLQKVTIPRGALNLESVRPGQEITLLASTTNLLIEKKTHPAIQWAFMLAASDVGKSSEDFFSKAGTFPKYLDLSFPLSPVANRFYTQGVPVVFQYFPLWLGSIADEMWVLVLAFIALIYPLYKWIMGVRSYPSTFFMQRLFIDLRDMDEDLAKVQSKEDAQKLINELDELSIQCSSIWLSETEARFYFNLKTSILAIRKSLEAKIASFDALD